jgi:hypothetical protein
MYCGFCQSWQYYVICRLFLLAEYATLSPFSRDLNIPPFRLLLTVLL